MKRENTSLLRACRRMNISLGRAASIELKNMLWVDYSLFDNIQKSEGIEKAYDIYKKVWLGWVTDILEEIKRELSIIVIPDLITLGRTAKYHFDNRGCFMNIIHCNETSFIGIVNRCAVVEYSIESYGVEVGCNYHKCVHDTELEISKYLVQCCTIKGIVDVCFEKAICKGDNFCLLKIQTDKNSDK